MADEQQQPRQDVDMEDAPAIQPPPSVPHPEEPDVSSSKVPPPVTESQPPSASSDQPVSSEPPAAPTEPPSTSDQPESIPLEAQSIEPPTEPTDASAPQEALANIEVTISPQPKPRKKAKPGVPAAEGINKKMFALTGGVPPLVVGHKIELKDKNPPTRWSFASFKNPARPDELELKHWVKETEVDKEYPFAQWNKPLSIIQYTDEEYESHLKDADWTKEETDYLIGLCKDFHMRFAVVCDRYEYPEKSRTLEDIMERYFSVAKTLQVARAAAAGTALDEEPFVYNKAREVARRQHLEKLYNRPKEIQDEEELLFHELRRREMHELRWSNHRNNILRLLGNHEMQVPAQMAALGFSQELKLQKKVKKPIEIDTLKKDRKLSIRSEDVDSATKSKAPAGVYMRSSKLIIPKSNILNKFKEIMEAHSVAPVCEAYDILAANVIHLIELKKQVEKQESEARALEIRKTAIKNGEPVVGTLSTSSSLGSFPSGAEAKKVRNFALVKGFVSYQI
ncbi:swr complex subunit [Chytridiales sp. JEL 0842]|nr:swr complex subunit [Chytridiales sp. JEL 0842]